jgi:hypothetical protein
VSDFFTYPYEEIVRLQKELAAALDNAKSEAQRAITYAKRANDAEQEAGRHEQARTWAETQCESLRRELACQRHHQQELSAELDEARNNERLADEDAAGCRRERDYNKADASEGRRLLRLLVAAGWENTPAGLRSAVLVWMGGES